MEFLYKNVSIYADTSDNLIIIPTGNSEKWGGAVDIDLAFQLNSPYTDEELEESINKALVQCFSLKPNEDIKETVIERFLKIKGYSKAVKERRFVSLFWNVNEGYIITPTKKVPRQGYVHINDKSFRLGLKPQMGEIGLAIREAMKLSTY